MLLSCKVAQLAFFSPISYNPKDMRAVGPVLSACARCLRWQMALSLLLGLPLEVAPGPIAYNSVVAWTFFAVFVVFRGYPILGVKGGHEGSHHVGGPVSKHTHTHNLKSRVSCWRSRSGECLRTC